MHLLKKTVLGVPAYSDFISREAEEELPEGYFVAIIQVKKWFHQHHQRCRLLFLFKNQIVGLCSDENFIVVLDLRTGSFTRC